MIACRTECGFLDLSAVQVVVGGKSCRAGDHSSGHSRCHSRPLNRMPIWPRSMAYGLENGSNLPDVAEINSKCW